MQPLQTLISPDGARLEFSLHGGHVCRWMPAGETDSRLFLSARADFTGSIRGGVPVIFPQFNARGPLPRHGLVRTAVWREVSRSPGELLLEIDETGATHPLWSQPYRLREHIAFGGKTLGVTLELHNPGPLPLAFTGALHTYFAVLELAATRLAGLGGARYFDAMQGEAAGTQPPGDLALGTAIDRIYPAAPAELELFQPGRRLRIENDGFGDVVVWNPGPAAATLTDLAPGDEQRFVCVEAAAVLAPLSVGPGQTWTGAQRLTALP